MPNADENENAAAEGDNRVAAEDEQDEVDFGRVSTFVVCIYNSLITYNLYYGEQRHKGVNHGRLANG